MVRGELATQPQRDNLGRLLGRRSTEGELAQAMHTEGVCLGDIVQPGVAAVGVNLAGVTVYAPVMTAVDLIASASLGLGLVTVGAGLRIADALKPKK